MRTRKAVRNVIYGICADDDAAASVVEELRALDVDARRIVVQSSEPLEIRDLAVPHGSGAMPWVAALGGLIGAVAGFTLAAGTQQLWPLSTGAMPIVTLRTNLIITYEMTLLGVIVATVLCFLVTARLPRWRMPLDDPEISEGAVLVGVLSPPQDRAHDIERALREGGGAARIVTCGPEDWG
ncbi:MAG: DUF3341 domain-containing protein [Luteitalea sp.]|nr:DUF3341 domain-containing protein [Luteitalea sp.]